MKKLLRTAQHWHFKKAVNGEVFNRGYILLTVLFTIVAMSTMFFVATQSRVSVAKLAPEIKQLDIAKKAVLNVLLSGRDAIDDGNSFGGMNDYPGVITCPELIEEIGTKNEGIAGKRWCHTSDLITSNNWGRIPWRRLGVNDIPSGGGGIQRLVSALAPSSTPSYLSISGGEMYWIVVDPAFTRGNLPSVSLTRKINNQTASKLKWDDGTGVKEVVAVLFAPNKPLESQTRPLISATNPPLYNNYLEISNPTAVYDQPAVTVRKNQISNDEFLTITRDEWLDVASGRVASTVINCLNKFAGEYSADNTRTFPVATTFTKFSLTSTAPIEYQASVDMCSNIFNRLTKQSDNTLFNNVYKRLNKDSNYRACFKSTSANIPEICFNPDDGAYSLPISINTTTTNLEELNYAINTILPSMGFSTYTTGFVPTTTNCSATSSNIIDLCIDDRWFEQWVDNVHYLAPNNGTKNITVCKTADNCANTDMVVIVGGSSAPVASSITTTCTNSYIDYNTNRYCLASSDRFDYRR